MSIHIFNINKYRNEIENSISDAIGRDVYIDGNISIAIAWPISLFADQITVANLVWASRPMMIHARRLQVQLTTLPLIRGDIDITKIVVEGANMLLESNSDGENNWSIGSVDKYRNIYSRENIFNPESKLESLGFKDILISYRDPIDNYLSRLEKTLTRQILITNATLHNTDHSLFLKPITIDLAGSDLSGNFIWIPGKTPKIHANLKSHFLDLSPLLDAGDVELLKVKSRIFSSSAIPLTVLYDFDADIRLEAKNLVLAGITLPKVTVRFILEKGQFDLSSRLADHKFDGLLSLAMLGRTAAISLAVKADNVTLSERYSAVSRSPKDSASLTLDVELSAIGESAHEFAGSVNGHFMAHLGNAKLSRDNGLVGSHLLYKLLAELTPIKYMSKYPI